MKELLALLNLEYDYKEIHVSLHQVIYHVATYNPNYMIIPYYNGPKVNKLWEYETSFGEKFRKYNESLQQYIGISQGYQSIQQMTPGGMISINYPGQWQLGNSTQNQQHQIQIQQAAQQHMQNVQFNSSGNLMIPNPRQHITIEPGACIPVDESYSSDVGLIDKVKNFFTKGNNDAGTPEED